jgi:tRNA (guanine-N7-)-methyltransferase
MRIKDSPLPLRSVRSFVRRQGRMSANLRQALVVLLPKYGIDPAQGAIDLAACFGRDAPYILEIGFGNGVALLDMAQHNPQRNYLGIDVHRPGVANVCTQVEKLSLTNLRVMCADVTEVLGNQIADKVWDAILIFFPDPWPKQRHQKRRLIQPAFVDLLVRKLRGNGILHLATDWEDYAKQMLNVLDQHPWLENLAGRGNFSERPGYRPLTKYEQRGQRQGHVVRDLVFKKRDELVISS